MARSTGNKGGPASHKEGCRCNPCSARRRETEAIAIATRDGVPAAYTPSNTKPLGSQLNADLPTITATGRSVRDRIIDWMAIRAIEPDLKNSDIAARLGISTRSLNTYIAHAVKEGWLRFDDPISRVEHEIVPKALDNLSSLLDQKDKQTTIEVAKGTIFKTYQEAKGISDVPRTVLALRIESSGNPDIKIISGQVVGKSKEIIDIEAHDERS